MPEIETGPTREWKNSNLPNSKTYPKRKLHLSVDFGGTVK